jgi:hypothetical protein
MQELSNDRLTPSDEQTEENQVISSFIFIQVYNSDMFVSRWRADRSNRLSRPSNSYMYSTMTVSLPSNDQLGVTGEIVLRFYARNKKCVFLSR